MSIAIVIAVMFLLVVIIVINLYERYIPGVSLFFLLALAFWLLCSISFPYKVKKTSYHPIYTMETEQGLVQFSVVNNDLYPISNISIVGRVHDNIVLKREEYEETYLGIHYPLRKTYLLVEKPNDDSAN